MRAAALALAGVIAALAGPAVTAADELDAAIGRALFRRAWTAAPSSTRANDGLGPLFNARSCLSCHAGLDRMPIRVAPDGTVASENLVLRLSGGAGRPDPVYGRQIQTAALPGHAPEGVATRHPNGRIAPARLAYGPLAPETRAGGRLAPPLRGLGLLAAVPEDAILANADPDDRDGDGVRGRPNIFADKRIGRFGAKAGTATLADQVALAFSLDLGMSTARERAPAGDCTPGQRSCLAGPHGGTAETPEIDDAIVDRLASFLASVPPAEPKAAADTADGARLFAAAGCAACHVPSLPSPHGPVRAFTDLLLHDLGPALDGGATEPGVAPTEWRTAPLWGIAGALERGAGLLHDGRAKDVAAAVGLHGGEAGRSHARFAALSPGDRRRLLDYVSGL